MQDLLSADLAQEIRDLSGENVFLCYQCQKCSSGCPAVDYFDLAPNQLLRALQLGNRDLVLHSKTIWLCAMCETCAVRCPHDINITRIMDVLKVMAQQEGIPCPVPEVVRFNLAALRGVRLFGRMYEAGLMGELYTRQLLSGTLDCKQLVGRDLPLALTMVKNGKLRLIPQYARPRIPPKKEAPKEAIAYYPGCSLHGTSREYDSSSRAVLSKLGLEVEEPEGWICCGSTPAHSTDRYLSVMLPVKNVVAMEKQGFREITTPCPSCFLRLRSGVGESREQDMQKRLFEDLRDIPGEDIRIDHLLTTITDKVGCNAVAQKVVRPLHGLKVVCYYGCIITRPPRITLVEDFEYPQNMDRLMKAIGADPLDWSYKTRCCGGSLGISQLSIALDLTRKILKNAKEVGADAIVVACPLCQVNLDARQEQISDQGSEEFHIPIIYFTQLLGLAFGIEPKAVEIDKHFVDPRPVLERLGGDRP